MKAYIKIMILVALGEVMVEVTVVVILHLIAVVVTVVLAEAAVEAGLPTFSVKFALSMVTLPMCAIFKLTSHSLLLIQLHSNLFRIQLVRLGPQTLGLILTPSLLLSQLINLVLC